MTLLYFCFYPSVLAMFNTTTTDGDKESGGIGVGNYIHRNNLPVQADTPADGLPKIQEGSL
jgi:hypothetical protein